MFGLEFPTKQQVVWCLILAFVAIAIAARVAPVRRVVYGASATN